jgi:hypothetical protein
MPEPWWYLKRRRNPAGVLGRPRSSVPLPERRKLARQKYRAKLVARGVCVVRLSMTTADAEQLRALAQAQNLSPGAFVGRLLQTQRET